MLHQMCGMFWELKLGFISLKLTLIWFIRLCYLKTLVKYLLCSKRNLVWLRIICLSNLKYQNIYICISVYIVTWSICFALYNLYLIGKNKCSRVVALDKETCFSLMTVLHVLLPIICYAKTLLHRFLQTILLITTRVIIIDINWNWFYFLGLGFLLM